MAETISIKCPSCAKGMAVPVSVAGKKIRCKGCGGVVPVPAAAGEAKPAAKPVAAKAPEKPADKPADKPRSKYDDDDDDGPTNYGAIKDDLEVPRCPFCAQELDPPDTLICLSCGYDLVKRRRHESKKVHALTKQDYIMHHLPAVGSVLAIIGMGVFYWIMSKNMGSWFADIGLQDDAENPITKKKEFVVPPGACLMPIAVAMLFASYRFGFFAYRRFVINWKPVETVKKEQK